MSGSVASLAAALSARLASTGIRTTPYMADTFTPPIALVGIEDVEYHATFAGGTAHKFTVFVIVARSDDRAGIALLEEYMSNTGAKSVRQALETEPATPDGLESSVVPKSGPPNSLSISGAAYIICPFEVHVYG